MEPGDVLLTPNWSMHGHGNRSEACAYWLDFLDVPLVQMLEPMFFEAAEEDKARETVEKSGQVPDHATKDSSFVFALKDTLRRFGNATSQPAGPFGTQIELGHPALATMALYMMRVDASIRTASYRTTANNIYAVVQGEGASIVDGERFEWRRGDVIAVPAWRAHCHEAKGYAILFRVTDEPVLQCFRWWREELASVAN